MIKKVLTVSAVTAMLLFTGCSNDAEDQMGLQQDLDSGNNASVIATLEAKTDRTDSDNLMLASAFMDEAGLSVVDILGMVSSTEEDADVSFASFVGDITAEKDADTLDNLQKAIDYYQEIGSIAELLGDVTAAPSLATSLEDATSDINSIALYLGLAYITKVSTVMSYLGDVVKWEDEGTDANMMATGCAMLKVYNANEFTNSANCIGSSVYTTVDYNGTSYEEFEVTIAADPDGKYPSGTYKRLANSTFDQLVLTDYSVGEGNTPVKDENLTVESALIETLNDGFDAILDAAPDDSKDTVSDYKTEMDTNGNGVVTVSEFTEYMSDSTN